MPTSTAVICPQCSKVSYLAGDSADVEKKCSGCGAKLVQAPKQQKHCVICGKDITSRRRMKDREGRYFCYECGIADNKRKEQMESYPCTMCKRPFTPDKMFTRDGVFFCKRCYGVKMLEFKEEEERKASGGPGNEDAKKKKKKLILSSCFAVGVLFFMLIQLKVIDPSRWFQSAASPPPIAEAKQAAGKELPTPKAPAPKPVAR